MVQSADRGVIRIPSTATMLAKGASIGSSIPVRPMDTAGLFMEPLTRIMTVARPILYISTRRVIWDIIYLRSHCKQVCCIALLK